MTDEKKFTLDDQKELIKNHLEDLYELEKRLREFADAIFRARYGFDALFIDELQTDVHMLIHKIFISSKLSKKS